MTDRDGETPEGRADLRVERALLDSARADEVPRETVERAWLRFAGTIAAASASSAGASPHLLSGTKIGPGVAAKWLVIGALGGSCVTAAYFRLVRGEPTRRVPAEASAPLAAPATNRERIAVLPASEPAPVPEAPPLATAFAGSSDGKPVPSRSAPHQRRSPAVSEPTPRDEAPPIGPATQVVGTPRASELAREVSALDAARAALTAGAFDQALGAIETYHRDFPSGALSADADVVALRALVGNGAHVEAAEHARRFLAEYPNDPHAAYVKSVAAAR
jgi:TolA-binding protein